MSDVASLITDLVSAGVSAELVGRVAAALASREAVVVKVGDESADRRRAADRQRKADARLRKSAEVGGVPETPSPSASPPRDIINPPITSPSSSLRSDNRAKRVLPAGVKSELDGFTEEFNSRFWPEWRNKVGKPDALKSWLRVRRQGVPLAEIMAGVDRYTADQQTSGRPWLNPATFLNQRRWEDAPAPQPMCRAGPPRQPEKRNPFFAAYEELMGEFNGQDCGTHSDDFAGETIELSRAAAAERY